MANFDEIDLQNLYADVKQRRQFSRAPKKLATSISSLLARKGYAQARSVTDCREAWNAAVGVKLAKNTRVGNITRGVLFVAVRNSSVNQELAFAKKKILKKLAQTAPQFKIQNLRFKVQEIE